MDSAGFRYEVVESFIMMQSYLEDNMVPLCRECGLTMQQLRILIELDRHSCKKAGDLGDTVGIQRGNIASICKKMEQNGWIERKRKKEDERVVLISLTEEGRKVKREVEKKMEEAINTAFSREPEETFEDIRKGMESLRKLMERINAYE